MPARKPAITFERDSAFGYTVSLGGHQIGYVGGSGRSWWAKTVDFGLGEHKTRREAVEALIDIDQT